VVLNLLWLRSAHACPRRPQHRLPSKSDLEVQFAGQTAHYTQVSFELVKQGNETRLIGTIPATLADFKIDPPSLLTLPVKNEIPVRVEMTWSQQ
jgi:hypothetical protein